MSSLERGLDVLLAVSEAAPCTVDEVARAVNLPLSTAYRYVKILRNLGYLEEDEYGVRGGRRLLQMALRTDSNRSLAQVADPVMQELIEVTGGSALLSVRVGMMALCIHTVQPRRHIRLSYELSTPQPLHAGASGKPLLAYAPPTLVEEIIASRLTTYTPATPDAVHLRRQLEMIRSTGYCLTVGELDEHVAAVGVPVFMGRTMLAALSVAGPVDRFDTNHMVSVRDHIVEAGAQIRRALEQLPARTEHTHLALVSVSPARTPTAS